jgi:hypothetical protein
LWTQFLKNVILAFFLAESSPIISIGNDDCFAQAFFYAIQTSEPNYNAVLKMLAYHVRLSATDCKHT